MEIQFAIVRSENREYLCYKAGEAYVDASNPMIAFTAGEDEFEIVEPELFQTERIRVQRRTVLPRTTVLSQWLVGSYLGNGGR